MVGPRKFERLEKKKGKKNLARRTTTAGCRVPPWRRVPQWVAAWRARGRRVVAGWRLGCQVEWQRRRGGRTWVRWRRVATRGRCWVGSGGMSFPYEARRERGLERNKEGKRKLIYVEVSTAARSRVLPIGGSTELVGLTVPALCELAFCGREEREMTEGGGGQMMFEGTRSN